MNKLFFGVILLLFSVSMKAQDAKSMIKDANKALKSYYLDPSGNQDKLAESSKIITDAFKANDLASNYDAQYVLSQIYNEQIALDAKTALVMGAQFMPKHGDKIQTLIESVNKGLELADKAFKKKQLIKVLAEAAPNFSALGNHFISQSEYGKAYGPLLATIQANNLLKANDQKDIFTKPEDAENHKYVTAICGIQAGETGAAKKMLMELADAGSKQPEVYSNLFNLTIEDDEASAIKYLEAGKKIDPTNKDLMFAEINYYIRNQNYDVLETKLQEAIAADPDNASIYSALGNVYMNLSQDAKDEESATKYFDKAMSYFNETLARDPKNFDATYSIGSLIYNKAAAMTTAMKELGMSKEDQKKFDVMKAESDKLFTDALPHFKKAEMLNPNDRNTLIALKEILARQDDFDASNEFKSRLEKIEAGEEITESYFK